MELDQDGTSFHPAGRDHGALLVAAELARVAATYDKHDITLNDEEIINKEILGITHVLVWGQRLEQWCCCQRHQRSNSSSNSSRQRN